MKKTRPIQTIYYKDPLNDEFSKAVITPKTIDETWDYIPKKRLWGLWRFITYRLIAVPIAFVYCKCKFGYRVKNRRVLRAAKGRGFFLYGNHTQDIGDAFMPTLSTFPRSVFVIVHPNNVSIPFLGRYTPYLGALPLPANLKAMRHFKEAVATRIAQKNCVMIYPEAHIWPYYTGIRPFADTSMRYPVELDAPSFSVTTVYRRRRIGLRPRTEVYFDGPFYPDEALPPRERARDLRDRIYAAMQARAALSDCEYIRYLPEEKKE